MTLLLPFKLKVPGTDEVSGFTARSVGYRLQGLLRLDRDIVRIEWGGVQEIQEVGALDVRDEQVELPDEWLEIPVEHLHRAVHEGGWWRPRVLLQARSLETFAGMPGGERGRMRFWYARRDGAAARDLVAGINAAIEAW